MNNDELYHYGVKGMKWKRLRAFKKDQTREESASKKSHNTISKSKAYRKPVKKTTKTKISKRAKIAIGTTAAVSAIAGIGAMSTSKIVRDKTVAAIVAKVLRDNM